MDELAKTTLATRIAETTMSDRALIIHLVQHIEVMHETMDELREQCAGFAAELAEYRPAFERFKPRAPRQPGRSIFVHRPV